MRLRADGQPAAMMGTHAATSHHAYGHCHRGPRAVMARTRHRGASCRTAAVETGGGTPGWMGPRSAEVQAEATEQWADARSAAAGFAAATAIAGTSMMGPFAGSSVAAEFDILNAPTPSVGSYVLDDARVLSKASEGSLRKSLTDLETETGYHVDVVTTRKLTFSADAYEFADKAMEKWYPSNGEKKKGLLLVVTSGKEGAVVGFPDFAQSTGDSIAGESIPFYGDKELWNEAVLSSVKRLEAVLRGAEDPGPPKVESGKTGRSYKTKEETQAKKFNFSAAVGGLLVISFVAPMLQYFAYTKSDD